MSDTPGRSVHQILEQAASLKRRLDENESDVGPPASLTEYHRTLEREAVSAAAGDVGAVISRLSDADPWVRREAAYVLGWLFASEAEPHLLARLIDPDEWVRHAAQRARDWIAGLPASARRNAERESARAGWKLWARPRYDNAGHRGREAIHGIERLWPEVRSEATLELLKRLAGSNNHMIASAAQNALKGIAARAPDEGRAR